MVSSEIASYLAVTTGLLYKQAAEVFGEASLTKKELEELGNANAIFGNREQLHQFIYSDESLLRFKNTSICEILKNPDLSADIDWLALDGRCR